MQGYVRMREFPDYYISESGVILNAFTERPMARRLNHQGITMVNLSKDKRLYTRSLSVLVAKQFVDNPYPSVYNSVIHLNGDRTDCRSMNLTWRPRWYALRYHRMFDEEPFRVRVYNPATNERFSSLRDFCTKYGLVESSTFNDLYNQRPVFHYGWIIQEIDPSRY